MTFTTFYSPDGNKPFNEPMLIYHPLGPLVFIWGYYDKKIWRDTTISKLRIKIVVLKPHPDLQRPVNEFHHLPTHPRHPCITQLPFKRLLYHSFNDNNVCRAWDLQFIRIQYHHRNWWLGGFTAKEVSSQNLFIDGFINDFTNYNFPR